MVLPGFIATEGFPATELRERALTRWVVSKPEKVAEAIVEAGPGGKAERYVPRPYALAAVARIVAPSLVRRVLSGGGAATLTTSTAAESPEVTQTQVPLKRRGRQVAVLEAEDEADVVGGVGAPFGPDLFVIGLDPVVFLQRLADLAEVFLDGVEEAEPLDEPARRRPAAG